ncbi:MAG: ParB N-terminal domain-containing protein, partial [Deltaproteobacteria bacterium]|nr:ParB N-terminal domain-containing protein [Deltaproteobacteria bacterium]
TRRATVDIDDVIPNDKQPRTTPKEDPELQRQIEANEGIFEPLLLEPHPTLPAKFRIIDGDRRWTNSKVLVEQNKPQYRNLLAEITEHTLDDEERFRVWIYIHRQRKEWDAKEKEMVARQLVKLVGRASAANILGVTVREVDKLVEVYDLAERLKNIRDPSASITWAREITGINKNLLTPSVVDTIVDKINEKLITNSKELRRLRPILKDPVAKDCFLQPTTTINDALEKLDGAPTTKLKKTGLAGDLAAIVDSIRKQPWTALAELRGDDDTLRTIEEAEKLLKDLKKSLKP